MLRFWPLVVLGFVLAGCPASEDGDDPGVPDVQVGTDGQPVDGGPDAMPDAISDAISDAMPDALPDAIADLGPPDASTDATVIDAAGPDAEVDAEIDAAVDATADAEVDAMVDAEVDAMVDAEVDAMVDAEVDAIVDAEVDAIVDAEIDATPVDMAAPHPDAAPPACRLDDDCPGDEECVGGNCLPPLDGTCVGPFVAVVGEVYMGETGGLGDDGGSCPGNNDLTAPEDIYRVVFDEDGPHCINTRGSEFDTMLYVRSRCGDPRSEVACQDDDFVINGPGGWAALTLEAERFRAYYVTVDGYGSVGEAPREGVYTLSITPGACQPPPECLPESEVADCGPDRRCDGDGRCADCIGDGDCEGGRCVDGVCLGCAVDAHCPEGGRCLGGVCEVDVGAGGDCGDPIEAVAGVRYRGETVGPGALAGTCGSINGAVDAPEAIFEFSAARPGPYCVSTADSALDTVLYVRTACADIGTELGCSDDDFALTGGPQGALTVQAEVGVPLAIVVDGFALPGAGEAGPFVLQITAGACAPR